jgi:hypothetical protein
MKYGLSLVRKCVHFAICLLGQKKKCVELYKHLSEDLVKALYLKWGGIALNVLESAENEDQ